MPLERDGFSRRLINSWYPEMSLVLSNARLPAGRRATGIFPLGAVRGLYELDIINYISYFFQVKLMKVPGARNLG